MTLTRNQLQNVCLLYAGTSKQCRYLRQDDKSWDKWHCLKHKKIEKAKIDVKIEDWLKECKKKGQDPHSQGVPLGDNCTGYPILKHIDQGYDV
jgi:hypothetical protein